MNSTVWAILLLIGALISMAFSDQADLNTTTGWTVIVESTSDPYTFEAYLDGGPENCATPTCSIIIEDVADSFQRLADANCATYTLWVTCCENGEEVRQQKFYTPDPIGCP